jgi:sugar phosphate isomerase/epimerase
MDGAPALTLAALSGALTAMSSPSTEWKRRTTRREVLATLAALGVGWVAGAGSGEAGRLAPIGVQLYTVRDLLEKDFAGTLAALAAIGFREIEFAGYHGRTPRAVREALQRAGLTAPAAHVPVASVRDELARLLEAARVIGHQYLVVAGLPERERTLDGYRAAADLFNRVGREVQAGGLQLAYHNHAFEFATVDGHRPYDVLLERCDPRHVAFEMDLYWITVGGQDPLTYFARWPGRFPLVHVKDSSGPPDHRMTDVGAGRIPWTAIFAHREQAGIRHAFIEHDAPADPLASVKHGYEYLRRLDM